MNKPTPTTHGDWRVIDGQLVNQSIATGDGPVPAPVIEQIPPGDPIPVATIERTAEAGEALPPIEDAIDAAPEPKPTPRRKARSNAQ